MAKYCVSCGKKLEDGEVCACTADNPVPAPVSPVINSENIKAVQKEILETHLPAFKFLCKDNLKYARSFLTKPVETMDYLLANNNYAAGWFYLAVNTLAFTLATLFIMKSAMLAVMSIIGSIFGEFLDMSDLAGMSDLPYLNIGIKLAIFNLASFALLVLAVHLAARYCCKSPKKIRELLLTMSLATIPMSAAYIASAALILVSIQAACAVILIGYFMTHLLNTIAMRKAAETSESQAVIFYPVSYIIFLGVGMSIIGGLL